MDAKGLGQTHLDLSVNLIGGPIYQSGAFFSFADTPEKIQFRVGVSFVSTEQACANAESEIGSSSFDNILARAKALWNEKLSKVEIDIANTPANITEMLYSSLYRASLTPVRFNSELRFFFLSKFFHRTMQQEKDKACLPVLHLTTSIPCIAGEPHLVHFFTAF